MRGFCIKLKDVTVIWISYFLLFRFLVLYKKLHTAGFFNFFFIVTKMKKKKLAWLEWPYCSSIRGAESKCVYLNRIHSVTVFLQFLLSKSVNRWRFSKTSQKHASLAYALINSMQEQYLLRSGMELLSHGVSVCLCVNLNFLFISKSYESNW